MAGLEPTDSGDVKQGFRLLMVVVFLTILAIKIMDWFVIYCNN